MNQFRFYQRKLQGLEIYLRSCSRDNLHLSEMIQVEHAISQYDDFLYHAMFQHRTIQESINDVRRFSDYSKFILPAGSMFDGIHLPEFSSQSGKVVQEMDFIMVLPNVTAREDASASLQYATLNGFNPAFVALKINNVSRISLEDVPVLEKRQDPRLKYVTVYENNMFLNNNFQLVFRRRMQFTLSEAFGAQGQWVDIKLKEAKDFYPVVTIRFTGMVTELKYVDSGVWPDRFVNEMFMSWFNVINRGDAFWLEKIFDLAPAIQGEWPAKFKEHWINRTRFWPDEDTVFKIASMPCHLVAKAQAQSTYRPLQWRFGFNIAENILCSKFTPVQRQTLMVLKALRRKYLQTPKVLASYHLKTTMFRFLESTPAVEVKSMSRGQMLMKLLEKLVESLQKRKILSFFIKETNLLGDVQEDFIEVMLTKIKDIRDHPSSYLTSELFRAVTLDREGHEFNPVYFGYI